GFTITQREPSHAAAEGKTDTPVTAADPGDQRGCVDRTHSDRSRDPAPISAVIDPATVVAGSESPGSIVNPSPAPGLDPHPVPIMIRSPAGRDGRHPDGAVGRHFTPGVVVVEIFRSDDVGRNIARGIGVIFALIADAAPVVKAVAAGIVVDLVSQGCAAGEARHVIAFYFHGAALSGSFAFAMPNSDHGSIAVGVHIETVLARFSQGESQVRRVNFIYLATI